MTFKIAEASLAASVATSGTFTVAYPDGTQAGSFAGAHGHKMWVDKHQFLYAAPSQFTLTFGASNITVTYLGTTTIPAGARVRVEIDVLGDNEREAAKAITLDNIRKANPVLLDLGSPITADADGVAASQSVSAAASFVLNGALVQSGVAVFDVPRNVVAAWTGTAVLTITGKDVDGNTVVEVSASGTSHTGAKAFKSVSSVSSSANITSATVGTGTKLGLPRYVPDASYILAELKNGVTLPRRPGTVFLCGQITEALMDAGTSLHIASPVAGVIRKMTTVAQGTMTTGGDVIPKIATVAVDGLTVVIADGAAAGELDSATATLGHASAVVAVGTVIEITLEASFNASADIWFEIEIDTSAAGQLSGTFVAGVTSAATGTTGDTRGTYSPLTAPDGTAGYMLVAMLPDPVNKGVSQYAG